MAHLHRKVFEGRYAMRDVGNIYGKGDMRVRTGQKDQHRLYWFAGGIWTKIPVVQKPQI